MSNTTSNKDKRADPVIKSKVTSGMRIALSFFVAITLGVFIFLWDGNYISGFNLPGWLGYFVFFPLISVILGLCINSLIQNLSCNRIDWPMQYKIISMIPLWQILAWAIIYMLSSLRWPIEGLVQDFSPDDKKALSSGFYGFWIALYTQSIMNGLSQVCPEL
jgi:hypothetical protein